MVSVLNAVDVARGYALELLGVLGQQPVGGVVRGTPPYGAIGSANCCAMVNHRLYFILYHSRVDLKSTPEQLFYSRSATRSRAPTEIPTWPPRSSRRTGR